MCHSGVLSAIIKYFPGGLKVLSLPYVFIPGSSRSVDELACSFCTARFVTCVKNMDVSPRNFVHIPAPVPETWLFCV